MQQKYYKKLSLQKKAISNLDGAQIRQLNGGSVVVSTYLTQYCINSNACVPVLATSGCIQYTGLVLHTSR
jgi:hypothetical protein